MYKVFLILILSLTSVIAIAQDNLFTGTLIHAGTKQVIVGANIVNLTSLDGTTSDQNGMFIMPAKVNDSIIIAFMGYKTINVRITQEKLQKHQTIYMLDAPVVLDEVIVSSNQLTGNLKIDVNLIPTQKPIDISPKITAMFGSSKPTLISRINDAIKKIMNPVDLIYNIFATRAKDIRRLKKIQEEDKVKQILANKFDREILSRLLKIEKKDVYLVLEICDYPEKFIRTANDLQILEAILNCYSHYEHLLDKKKH